MDIGSGLAAASEAIKIAKQLKELDRSIGDAEFKLQLASLSEALADTKVALAEAKIELLDKQAKILELEQQIQELRSGAICPICNSGKMKVLSIGEHPMFGEVGVKEKQLQCDNSECGFRDKEMYDPLSMVAKK